MSTFVLLHGAGGRAADWHRVTPHLQRAGNRVIAVDLPCDQPVGLAAYRDSVLRAIDHPPRDLVLVAQSLSGFVAPLVCEQVAVAHLVLVAAMIPTPGESGGDWWANVGHAEALAAQDLPDHSPETLFVHDVPAEVLAVTEPPRDQTATLFEEPWPLEAWPEVPTSFLVCRDDRFFPADWLRCIVRDRLGIDPIEVPGGHAAHLSRPRELAEAIVGCSSGSALTHP
jgi:pimeloyl-ACP methyl ester carboxylesterase